MIKTISAIIFALLSITTAKAAESCQVLSEPVETACDYPNALKLTSAPDKLTVDKSNCNVEMDKNKWKEQPGVQFPGAKPDKTYTVVALDPDAPHQKKGEYHLHWVIANIPGKDFQKGDLSKGRRLQGYKGPGPPENTGLHRYIFLAFEEEQLNQNVTGSAARVKFGLLPWLKRQSKRLCGPVAGVQFTSQYQYKKP